MSPRASARGTGAGHDSGGPLPPAGARRNPRATADPRATAAPRRERSQGQLHSVDGDLDAGRCERLPFRALVAQDRVGVVDVDQNPAARLARQKCQAPLGAPHRPVRHVFRAPRAEAGDHQLVGGPEGAVEEEDIGPRKRLRDAVRRTGNAGKIGQPPAGTRVANQKADVVLRRARANPLQVQRRLSRRRDRGQVQARLAERQLAIEGQRRPGHLAGEPLQRAIENVAGRETGAHRLGRVNGQRMRFAQREQPQAMVEIAVRQHQAGDRGMARRPRRQRRAGLNLRPDLRRDVDQEPGRAVGADRDRFLGARLHTGRSAPDGLAVGATAIPLRKAAAGRGTEDADFHVARSTLAASAAQRRAASGDASSNLLGVSALGATGPQGSRSEKSLPYPPISALMLISMKDGVSHFMAFILRLYPGESRAGMPARAWSMTGPNRAIKNFAAGRKLLYSCVMSRPVFSRTVFATLLALTAARAHAAPAPPGPEIYVSAEESGEIIVVDVDPAEVAARIPIGKRPRGIKLSRDGKLLYVALSGSPRAGPGVDESKLPPADRAADGIGVVDLASRKLLRTLPSGQDPESFDLSRDGKTLFVSNEETAEMSALDLRSGKIKGKAAVGQEPEGVTLRPDGKVVFVTSESDNAVFAVDTKKLTVLGRIATGPRPRGVVFTHDGATAFVTCENGAAVTVVDVAKIAPSGSIKIEPKAKTVLGPRPMGETLSPDGKTLYVSNGRGESVAVIDVASRKVERLIDGVGARPWGIATSADGKKLYTANGPSNDVSIVDLASGQVEKRIKVGGLPWGLVVAPAR